MAKKTKTVYRTYRVAPGNVADDGAWTGEYATREEARKAVKREERVGSRHRIEECTVPADPEPEPEPESGEGE